MGGSRPSRSAYVASQSHLYSGCTYHRPPISTPTTWPSSSRSALSLFCAALNQGRTLCRRLRISAPIFHFAGAGKTSSPG